MPQNNTQSRTLKKGFILLEYEIIDILGSGGFGITYKAHDKHLQKSVVIKEYMPTEFATRATQDSKVVPFEKNEQIYTKGKQRFLEEARLLAQFDHPSIVKTHRFFEANNTAYFVMDYYEGITLKDYILSRGSKVFEQDNILEILMPILEGLKVVHSYNFLHRDIAPDNIFLRKNKLPVLIDFGAARNAIGSKSKSISAIIKPGYSPPEQYSFNSNQTPATDIYAISAVIYEMISGKKVPESTYRQTELLNNNPDPLEDIVENYSNRYSRSFLETIQRGLNLVQKDRIQSVEEFQQGLINKDISNSSATIALSKEEQKSGMNKINSLRDNSANTDKKTSSSNKFLYGVIALLFTLIVAGGTYFLNNKDEATTSKHIAKDSSKQEKDTNKADQPQAKEVLKENKVEESTKPIKEAKESKKEVIGSSSCNEGNAKACTKDGDNYYTGDNGYSIDFKKAALLYKKGCDGGDYTGCSNLGILYDFGKGVKKDITKAKELYKKGCDGKDMGGCKFLGMMYYYGRGVKRDYQKAKSLLKEPCYRGDDEACNVVSKIKNMNLSPNSSSGNRVEAYKKACDNGDFKRCQDLGYMYYSGTNVKKDYKKSGIYYEKACNGGLALPCAARASMLYGGIGVRKNYKKAYKLYKKACDKGDKTSCSVMGDMCYNGKGVKKSYHNAFRLYKKACNLGRASSCNNLATMHYFGLGTRKNKEEAIRLFKQSCRAGYKKSCSNLERIGKGRVY